MLERRDRSEDAPCPISGCLDVGCFFRFLLALIYLSPQALQSLEGLVSTTTATSGELFTLQGHVDPCAILACPRSCSTCTPVSFRAAEEASTGTAGVPGWSLIPPLLRSG